jgi:hypothetical protein
LKTLRFTLISEGSSDRALLPVLEWLLQQHSSWTLVGAWPDLRRLRRPPQGLEEKIRAAMVLAPCEVLFIHRDADREPRRQRALEIERELASFPEQPAVCVVPVRTTEAWLLFAENAIRFAADNPNGRVPLSLPSLDRVERVTDPKKILYAALRQAGESGSRRRRHFSPEERVHRVAQLIDDFSPLRRLLAFEALEADVKALIAAHGWA